VAGINRIADALEQANLLAKQSMPDQSLHSDIARGAR